MKFIEITLTAIRSLGANRLRTVLAILGIVIGVASVITLVSVGTGAQAQVTENISQLGTNLVNVQPGFSFGRRGRVSSSRDDLFTLDLAAYMAQAAPSVSRIIPSQQSSGLLVRGDENLRASIIGVTPEYGDVMNYSLLQGRFIRDFDLEEREAAVVLGYNVAQTFFGDASPIGHGIIISMNGRNVPFRIVGVMAPKGQVMFANYDDQVYIPITTLLQRLTGSRTVAGYVAEAKSAEQVNAAIGEISYFLSRRTNGEGNFRVTSQTTLLDTLSDTINTFTTMLAAIAGISLLVGGIGIMNIMLVSVTERTREIGLRKALGALRRDLIMQFLTEAVVLSVGGGALGIAVGWVGSRLIERFADLPAAISPESVVVALGFSMAVGLVFGVYPALRAAQLDPVVALRRQ